MSSENVKEYFKQFKIENSILFMDKSTATVELAAQALNVIPARIAKTLSFCVNDSCVLIVLAGDRKIDNKKFKESFKAKAKMLAQDETEKFTGHAVGGVCPFAVPENVKIYLDISLKRFETIFPACGSSNSAIELTCDELFKYSNAIQWIDVCKQYENEL